MLINKGLRRDMRPYVEFLKNLAKYHKLGKQITILEIGTKRGVSTTALLTGLSQRLETDPPDDGRGHLFSIDIDNRNGVIKDKELRSYWTFIHDDSTKAIWENPIDILFIDGQHHSPFPEKDYAKYEPYVKNGGYIIFHDVTHTRYHIRELFDSITYKEKLILTHNMEGMGIIRKI